MGRVGSIGLADLVRTYDLNTFVETGTGWGQSISDALLMTPLTDIRSIEIDEETYLRNNARFNLHKPRLRLYHGDSRNVLPEIITGLSETARVLWYLDAHFPGTGRENPPKMLPLTIPAEEAVPLDGEVERLLLWRPLSRDVIVVDDRCLFEAGGYTAGDDPRFRVNKFTGLERLESALRFTHDILRNTIDTGYVICTPRKE
jgi:hypothetical protein